MAKKKDRIQHQADRKHEAQADLKKLTDQSVPKGAHKELVALRNAIRKIIGRAQDRLDKLRKPENRKGPRTKIVEFCKFYTDHAAEVHYAQIRPMPLAAAKAKQLPLTTDCSGFATCAYYYAGAPDPNGLGYNGQGYTGTLYAHCKHISAADAKPGDLVEFGGSPGSHVVVYAGGGMCWSHGQEAGPLYISVAAEAQAHAGQSVNYLRAL